MGNFANSEDPDEMQQNVAFHQGLHCLPSKSIFIERNTILFEPVHEISTNVVCAASKASDQPAHMHIFYDW